MARFREEYYAKNAQKKASQARRSPTLGSDQHRAREIRAIYLAKPLSQRKAITKATQMRLL